MENDFYNTKKQGQILHIKYNFSFICVAQHAETNQNINFSITDIMFLRLYYGRKIQPCQLNIIQFLKA